MTLSLVVLALVTLQRLGELILANRNTRRLRARGGVESGAGHYPFIVLLHGAWLAGLWILAWNRPIHPLFLAAFIALQVGRVWVIATLGERWTTRVITLPGAPLIRVGPYRFTSHPNYLVVAGEIAILPLAFGLWGYAALFSALNAIRMWVRLRSESQALASATGAPTERLTN